jgi:SPP1 family predicted phage head-tail adaptor
MANNQPKNPVELIEIQANYPYSDPETVGVKDNWKTFCQVWAELQIGSGREFFGAKQINAELSGLVKTLQYIKGINPTMRVKCSRGIFDITATIDLREQNKNELHLKRVE